MNNKQRVVLFFIIIVIAVMFLFPPFYYTYGTAKNFHFYGYNFFFYRESKWHIDVYTLIMQFIGTLAVGGLAFLLVSDRRNK